MITAWRLVKTRYASAAFDGEGARLYGGRWNSPGTVVAYAAATVSLAVLEVLVHLEAAAVLSSYSLVSIEFDDALVETLSMAVLPPHWWTSPPPQDVQAIGDRWIREGRSAVLRVPSAVIPSESIYLFNVTHPDFASVQKGVPAPYALDRRLL